MGVRNPARSLPQWHVAHPQPAWPTSALGATIVILCTANRCRSPLAEHLMRQEAARRGLGLEVTSMGLLESGQAMPERGVAVAAEFGLDLRGHRSQRLRLDRLAEADLVLGMSRTHIREAVSALPGLWPRAFTLKQFARFVVAHPVPRRTQLVSWIESEAGERSRGELLGHAPHDDIADPLRASASVWRTVIREIQENVVTVLEQCAPMLRTERGVGRT